jgi:hypothetical protein
LSQRRDLLEAAIKAERATRKLAVVLPLERRLKRQLIKTWRMQSTAARAALARHSAQFTLQEAVDPAELGTATDIAIVTSPVLINAIQVVSDRALLGGAQSSELDLSVDASFTLAHPDAVSWLTKHGADRVADIDDVTRRYIRTIVTQAADEGWSYSKTATAIKDRFIQFAVGVPQEHIQSRAELVAVTEVGEAYEKGASIVAAGLQSQGLVIEKSWLAEDDPCPECEENAADGWIGESDTFASGDDEPLAHPGCRCTNERRVVNPDDGGD